MSAAIDGLKPASAADAQAINPVTTRVAGAARAMTTH